MINKLLENKYTYETILCRPNRDEVCFVVCSDLSFQNSFREFNVLDISISHYIEDAFGNTTKNPCWDIIKPDFLIHLLVKEKNKYGYYTVVHEQYFVIENQDDDGNINGNIKKYKCGAYEKTFFSGKILDGFRDRHKVLYDPNWEIDDGEHGDGLHKGILNYMLDYKCYNSWTVKHMDSSLLGIKRVFVFSDSTLINVVRHLEELYKCFIIFDNVNMTIAIYEAKVGALGENKGLIISDTNYATSINMSSNTDGVCTRLFVHGKNQAHISQYNPTGQRYIDDFTFFLPLMSDSLREAVLSMKSKINNELGLFDSLVTQLNSTSEGSAQWVSIMTQIRALWERLEYKNNFTQEQLKELAFFIRETSVTINEISDEKQLYEYGVRHLKTIAYLPITITVSSPDIFAMPDYKDDWVKITKVGDFANLLYAPFGLNYLEIRMTSYTHNPIANSLSLTFSNSDDITTRGLLDASWINTFTEISNMVNAEADQYRAFDQNRDSLVVIGMTPINAGGGNPITAGNGVSISGSGVISRSTDGATQMLRIDNNGLVAGSGVVINNNGLSAGEIRLNNNGLVNSTSRNRIYISPTNIFRLTILDSGERDIMWVDPTTGRLQINESYVDYV